MVDLSGVGFNKIKQTADALGISVEDLLKQYSYETGTTFDPRQPGPITQHGQHRGAIQFGEPQARAAGVDFSTPESAFKTQFGPDGGIVNYATSSGFVPGQHGPLDLYSTINAGAPGLYNRTDANNGGAWGTVADKFNHQIPAHAANVEKLMYDIEPAQIGAETLATLQQTAEGGRLDHLDPDAPVVDFLSQFEGAIARSPTVSTSGGSTGSFLPFIEPVEETRGDKIKRGIFNMADNMASMNKFYKAGYRGDAGEEIVDRSLKKKSRNKTAEMLQAQGREDLANAILTQALTPQQALQMHQADKLAQLRQTGGGGASYGKTPNYMRMPDGSVRTYVVGDDGSVRFVDLEGGEPMTTAATTADLASDVKKKQTYERAKSSFNEQAPMIGALYEHPYLESDPGITEYLTSGKKLSEMTGIERSALSPEAMNFITMHEQVTGKQFLAAYEQLKGAGPITDREGAAATAAVARMDRGLSPADYRVALKEYYFHMQNMIDAAEKEMRGIPVEVTDYTPPWDAAPAPAVTPPAAATPPAVVIPDPPPGGTPRGG